jgi:hypothetical protein
VSRQTKETTNRSPQPKANKRADRPDEGPAPCVIILPLLRQNHSLISDRELATYVVKLARLGKGGTVRLPAVGLYIGEGELWYIDPVVEFETTYPVEKMHELKAEVLAIGGRLAQESMYFKVCPNDTVDILPVDPVSSQAPKPAGGVFPKAGTKRANTHRTTTAPQGRACTVFEANDSQVVAVLARTFGCLLAPLKKCLAEMRSANKKRAA